MNSNFTTWELLGLCGYRRADLETQGTTSGTRKRRKERAERDQASRVWNAQKHTPRLRRGSCEGQEYQRHSTARGSLWRLRGLRGLRGRGFTKSVQGSQGSTEAQGPHTLSADISRVFRGKHARLRLSGQDSDRPHSGVPAVRPRGAQGGGMVYQAFQRRSGVRALVI